MNKLLLDACVMINLAASGVPLRELASGNHVTFAMARIAALEVLYIAAIDCGGTREEIDVMADACRGDLAIVDLRPDELSTFVEFARHVDDGEAATLAVAIHRCLPVATDDRKARRIAQARTSPIKPVTTAGLLRDWATDHEEPAARVADALRSIEVRASFVPGRNDPHRDWWMRSRG